MMSRPYQKSAGSPRTRTPKEVFPVETTNGIGCAAWFAGPEWPRAVDLRMEHSFILTKLLEVPGFRAVYIDVLIKPYSTILAAPKEIKPDQITQAQWRALLQGVGATS